MTDFTKEPTPIQSRLIDARYELTKKVFGDVPKAYSHAVLCQVGLPYRKVDHLRNFQRISGQTSLQLEAGHIPNEKNEFVPIGLPYGPSSRLILIHLCSRAIRSQSRLVECDDSMTAFAKSIGITITGRNLRTLRDQMLRMSVVQMRLAKNYGDYSDVFSSPIFSKFRVQMPKHPGQRCLWPSFIEFSPEFFESLTHNAVPVRLSALQACRHSCRSLDVLLWLSHRLHRVRDPVKLRWTTLRFQFGRRSQKMSSFKRLFKTALTQVLMVYPKADVRLVHGGIELRYSPPPVPFKEPALLES